MAYGISMAYAHVSGTRELTDSSPIAATTGVVGSWGRRRSGFIGEKSAAFFQAKRADKVTKGTGSAGQGAVYKSFFWRPLY